VRISGARHASRAFRRYREGTFDGALAAAVLSADRKVRSGRLKKTVLHRNRRS